MCYPYTHTNIFIFKFLFSTSGLSRRLSESTLRKRIDFVLQRATFDNHVSMCPRESSCLSVDSYQAMCYQSYSQTCVMREFHSLESKTLS